MWFANQTRNLKEAIFGDSDDESFFDIRVLQPEFYRIFNEFSAYDRCVENCKKLLSYFRESNNENSFFDLFTYGLMFKLTEEKKYFKG